MKTTEILEPENILNVDLETGKVETTETILQSKKDIVDEWLQKRQKKMAGLKDAVNDNVNRVKTAISQNIEIAALIEKALINGKHYGKIPGIKTKSLYQAGADVLARIYGLTITYELVNKDFVIDQSYLDFTYKAVVKYKGKFMGEAIASCNSLEKKWRLNFQEYSEKEQVWKNKRGGASVFDIKNTIEQMSQKRAMVRAIRKILGIAGAFTQDIENMELGDLADKNTKMDIYQFLYTYDNMAIAQGKNKTAKKDFLKLKILKPILEKYCNNRNYHKWNVKDIAIITEKLQEHNKTPKIESKEK